MHLSTSLVFMVLSSSIRDNNKQKPDEILTIITTENGVLHNKENCLNNLLNPNNFHEDTKIENATFFENRTEEKRTEKEKKDESGEEAKTDENTEKKTDLLSLVQRLKEMVNNRVKPRKEPKVSFKTYLKNFKRYRSRKVAKPEIYPFMAQVLLKDRFLCEGAIIDKKWIITAAHCFDKFNESSIDAVSVGVGVVPFGVKIKDEIKIESVDICPGYEPDNLFFDLALIKLVQPLEFSKNVAAIKLADTTSGEVQSVGWSLHYKNQNRISKYLYYTKSKIIQTENCGEFFKNFEKEDLREALDSIICVDSTMGTRDEGCYGGVASSLVFTMGNDLALAGISTSIPGCDQKEPAFFSRIYSHLQWVNGVIRNSGKEEEEE